MHNYKCVTLRLQRNVELRDNKPNIHVIALGATNFINFTSLGLGAHSCASLLFLKEVLICIEEASATKEKSIDFSLVYQIISSYSIQDLVIKEDMIWYEQRLLSQPLRSGQ